MFTVFLTILVFATLLATICEFVDNKEGEIYLNAITGCMIGVLKTKESQELYDQETEKVVDYQTIHTLQICIFFCSFTFVWVERHN